MNASCIPYTFPSVLSLGIAGEVRKMLLVWPGGLVHLAAEQQPTGG